MKDNLVMKKSMHFAVRIVGLSRFLHEQKEFVLSKQVLRSGTAIGALIKESEHAESTNDFIHKLSIAQKENNETIYWLELLKLSNYISEEMFESLNRDAVEIMKLLTSIIKSSKEKKNSFPG
jgi:four helix bundle protein